MAGKINLSESNNETRIEWKINHFLIRDDNLIISPDFILFNSKWFLQLHLGSTFLKPFSNTGNDSRESLRMSLLTLNPTTQYHIEYKMGIQLCNGSEIITEKFELVLKKGFNQTPQRRKLVSRKEFERSRNIIFYDNTLTVSCTSRLISAVNPDKGVLSPITSTYDDLSSSLLLFCNERESTGEITLDESQNETRIEWRITDCSNTDSDTYSPDFVLFNSKWFMQIEKLGIFIESLSKPYIDSSSPLTMSVERRYPYHYLYIEYEMGIQKPNGSPIRTVKRKSILSAPFDVLDISLKIFSIISSSDILDSENSLKVFCTMRLRRDINSLGGICLLDNLTSFLSKSSNGIIVGEITLDNSKNETRIEWMINHFFARGDILMKCPDFIIFKTNWFLQITRNNYICLPEIRNRNIPGKGLCMCLQRDFYSTAEHHIEYRMGITRPDGSEIITEKFESVFQPRFRKTLPGRAVISEEDLEKIGHTLTHGNTLKVFCTVRLLNDNPAVNVTSSISSTPYGSEASYENSKSINSTKDITTLSEKLKDLHLSKSSSTQTENLEVSSLPKEVLNFDEQFKGNSTSSEISKYVCPSKGIYTLSENFEDLYKSKRFADVTIKVRNKEFLAHKTILSTRSDVFAKMFEHDTLEKRSNVVDITDSDPHSFENFLLYLYTGKLDTVSSTNAANLFKTADKYGMSELKNECVRCMVRDMTVGSFCDIFHLAVLHREFDLLDSATNFFILNASSILITKDWLTLLEQHTSLCNELLVKFAKISSGLSRRPKLTPKNSKINRISERTN